MTRNFIVFFLFCVVSHTYPQSKSCLIKINHNELYGFINNMGNLVITPMFNWVSDPSIDDLICFEKDTLFGFIDANSKIHYTKYQIYSFNNGLASFIENNKIGFINSEGNIAIEPIFSADSIINGEVVFEADINPFFSEGLCSINLKSNKDYLLYGYINCKGKVQINPNYIVARPFNQGLAWVLEESKNSYYINTIGQKIIQLRPNEFGNCFSEDRALICVDNNGQQKFYFIDKKGKPLSSEFDDAGDFHDEYARVKKDGKWGYINSNCKFTIHPSFFDASDFSEGLASVTILDTDNSLKTGIIDKKGKFILPPEVNVNYGSFRCGIVLKKIGTNNSSKVFFVDRKGNIIWNQSAN